jgi:hypothetical protein
MVPTDAAVIAGVRAAWPALTTAAASDAFFVTSLLWARAIDNGEIDPPSYLQRLVCLAAHRAYAVDPAGLLGSGSGGAGATSSVRTRDLAVSYAVSAQASSSSAVTAWLATTAPGREYLALRDSRAEIAAPFVVF